MHVRMIRFSDFSQMQNFSSKSSVGPNFSGQGLISPNQNVKAVLGPTNTGKTHYAIERMLAYSNGIIGLPLRLLAREVYEKICQRVGSHSVALITGEERIIPKKARYWIATVEAMPQDIPSEFIAIDEIQMASDFDRGHIFTQRILSMRGRSETLLLGAATMGPILKSLLGPIEIIERPRLSQLQYAGSKKITRVPPRTAIIAFSASEVYAIAELVRRQRGGAAIVMGALSPRTRNAQVEMYQNGDVDILVATDAIGMGLNLDIEHVAFSSDHKFDGRQTRPLTPAEMGQIAGRAGRHLNDGTFGVTGHAAPLENEMVERLHNHDFDAVKILQWRNPKLDFSSVAALLNSLDMTPDNKKLTRVPTNTDQKALENLRHNGVSDLAKGQKQVELLWECCQIPDFPNISPNQHAQMVTSVFTDMISCATISKRWFAEQVNFCDNITGDIDALSNRIKQIRTWTFIANKKDWLNEQEYWQHKTRDIENRLSDALHERLMRRFVDKRTSILIRHLKDKQMSEPEINSKGEILIEGHLIGSIEGFRFKLAKSDTENDNKSARSAAASAIAPQILHRARTLIATPNDKIVLTSDGFLRWKGEIVAELAEGDEIFSPRILVLADESLNGKELEQVEDRLNLWMRHTINTQLEQILALRDPLDLEGGARGIAFQLSENLGILPRAKVAAEIKALEQEERAKLRKYGVRFGAYHIYLPLTLKPAPRELALILFALKNGGLRQPGVSDIPAITLSGRTSFAIDRQVNKALYEIAGFKVADRRAVRVDILERLADLIRPLISFDPARHHGTPPEGAAKRNGFQVTVQMTSLLGCAGEDFASILKSLGYRIERTKIEPEKSDDAKSTDNGSHHPADDKAEAEKEEDAKSDDNADLAKLDGVDVPPTKEKPEEDLEQLAKLDGVKTANEQEPKTEQAATSEQEAKTPAEPEFLEIWFPVSRRPQNFNQNKSGSQSAKNSGNARPGGKANNKKPGNNFTNSGNKSHLHKPSSHKSSANKRPAPKRKEKPIDPDSPFAALAVLKLKDPKK